MTLHRIDFSAEYLAHLRVMGVRGIHPGRWLVHGDTAMEGPVDLNGAHIWDAPVSIGAFTYLGIDTHCTSVKIGRYCSIAKCVQVGLSRHPADRVTTSPISWMHFPAFEEPFTGEDPFWQRKLPLADYEDRPITTIGNDVWIGASAYLKDGIVVGDGAIIGAHAVVTRDVPAYAIVAGNPARILRMRFDDATIDRMQRIAWWRYNLLELAIDLSDTASALDTLEARIAGGLPSYDPEPINLFRERRRFKKMQRMMEAA